MDDHWFNYISKLREEKKEKKENPQPLTKKILFIVYNFMSVWD
jgi:hypothetical protein